MSIQVLDQTVGTVNDRIIEIDTAIKNQAACLASLAQSAPQAAQLIAALQAMHDAMPMAALESLKQLVSTYQEANILAKLP